MYIILHIQRRIMRLISLLVLTLMLASTVEAQTTFGPQQVITTQVNQAGSVYAVDLDGDGDADALSASTQDDKIAWYENDGSGSFGPQQVITTQADGATSVYAADLDGDGDGDVLSASFFDDKIAWYANDGSGGFGPPQIITTQADGAVRVYAVDLDGDGDFDVLSASQLGSKIAWYENDGSGSFGPQQVITTQVNQAFSVYAADLDGDGDADVLSASFFDDKIAWYANDGSGGFGPQQVITTQAERAFSVYAADLDSDGDFDVLSASELDDKIAWYANDGLGGFGPQQVITTQADAATSVYAADLDSDGDFDVLSASYLDGKIASYENNDGSGSFSSQQVISQVSFARSVYAADLDGDGDLDVLSSGNDIITWYENLGPNQPPIADAGADQDDIVLGQTVTLDGSVSSDPDDDPLTYAWTLTDPDDNPVALSDDTAEMPTFVAAVRGIYTATLVVNDGTVESDPDNALVTVVNRAPVADAGADQTVLAGESVSLDGSASSDPDGDPLTYAWTLDGPGSPALDDASAIAPAFCAAEPGEYTATLTVNDGSLDSDPDAVLITALSTEEALDNLVADVEALVDAGTLNNGQAGGLTRKLDQAQRLLEKGKTAEALAVLADYQMQLADLEAEGVLSMEQQEALSEAGEAIAATLETPCSAGAAKAGALAEAGVDETPSRFELGNYPNPFNPVTTIGFALPAQERVQMSVYDMLGREVARLVEGPMEAGHHEVRFDAGLLPSGTYLVRLEAGAQVKTHRVVLLK